MVHKIGFIGLGNLGGKLAGSLLRNGCDLTVRDLNETLAGPLRADGARWGSSPREMAERCGGVGLPRVGRLPSGGHRDARRWSHLSRRADPARCPATVA
jgi:hypothetical protein